MEIYKSLNSLSLPIYVEMQSLLAGAPRSSEAMGRDQRRERRGGDGDRDKRRRWHIHRGWREEGGERIGGGKERRTLEDPPRHAATDCDLDSHPHGFTILLSITPETGFSKSIPLIPSLAYSNPSITLIYILNPTIYYLKFYYLNTNLIIHHLTNKNRSFKILLYYKKIKLKIII